MIGYIPLTVRELASQGYTPETFADMPVGNQQLVAAQIYRNKGDVRTATLLQWHNPNVTQFVIESDGCYPDQQGVEGVGADPAFPFSRGHPAAPFMTNAPPADTTPRAITNAPPAITINAPILFPPSARPPERKFTVKPGLGDKHLPGLTFGVKF